jgi:hypothetical protein
MISNVTQPDTVDVPSMSSALDATAGAVVDEDLPCFRCGYNVRGLACDGQCPECAASIAETLRRHAAELAGRLLPLDDSDPRWVRKMSWSCALLLFGGVGIAAAHVMSILQLRMPIAVQMPLFFMPFVLLAMGAWLAGSREPGWSGRRGTWVRMLIRAGIVGWVLALASMIAMLMGGRFNALRAPLIAIGVASAVTSGAFFWRLREFAARLSRRMLRHACTLLALLSMMTSLALCVPGLRELQYQKNAYIMLTPEPIIGGSMLLAVLPYALTNVPRFDWQVAAWAVMSAGSISALVVLAVFTVVLRQAARRSRDAAVVDPLTLLAAPD